MYFSPNIKLLRMRRNRTQDVVANELGVSPQREGLGAPRGPFRT